MHAIFDMGLLNLEAVKNYVYLWSKSGVTSSHDLCSVIIRRIIVPIISLGGLKSSYDQKFNLLQGDPTGPEACTTKGTTNS